MATTVYPVLCATDVGASAAFYREFFDFDVTFDSDWYVSLRHPDGAELAILDSTHPTIPEGYRERARGVLVNVEVDDVDAVAARLDAAGVTVVQELRDEAFGQRHVIVRDTGDVLVDVITEIEPSAEFLAAFGSTD